MEYKVFKNQKYTYWCDECGNEFTKNYQCEPDYCRDCHKYGTFHEEVDEIVEIHQFCPMCNHYFKTSEYLNDIFAKDEKARWLANMVTHHRHEHISSWDSTWGRNGYANRFLSDVDYDEEKRKVNERAKRQILRKSRDYMILNGFTVEDVLKLQNTETKTIELYQKLLGSKKDAA